MVDCGAAGSAIDRVTRVGTDGSAAVKAISSFIGNVSNSTQNPMLVSQAQMMPAAAPEFIQNNVHNSAISNIPPPPVQVLPNLVSAPNMIRDNQISGAVMNQMNSAWMEGGGSLHVQNQQLRGHHTMPGLQSPSPHMMQMHAQMQIQMQNQQMMFMNMQQQRMMQMNMQQQQQQMQKQASKGTIDKISETNDVRFDKAWEETEREKFIEELSDQNDKQGNHQNNEIGGQINVEGIQIQQDEVKSNIPINVEERAWYEGVENEFREEMERLKESKDNEFLGGATIEELAEAWEKAENQWDGLNDFTEETSPLSIPYQFQPESTTLPPQSARKFMEQGHRHFHSGEIQSAILSFEAALQTETQPNANESHDVEGEAWYMLGKCHAENDEDVKAISCLERAVERDPYNLDALLALGVSYVNELNHAKALSNLKMWVQHNPKYAGMEIEEDPYGYSEGNENGSEMDQVQSLLLQSLQWDQNDPDVKEALGVCYNVSRDYEAAVDSLQRALKVKPNDYQLWNKLGATLANSNRSEEALPNYLEAIKLKPRYARAWLNMAISHSNLQNFEEAARCYLQTLSLNPDALHCWSYLRIALTCMERWDLLPLVAAQDLKQLGGHFDFVKY